MNNLFSAELLRFRTWAIVAMLVHLVVLGFMSRIVDLAQQPRVVYQVFGMVYMAAGTLLGLYQMGSYRRQNHWLNLLHRPLHRHWIALALCGAGAVVCLLAVALPIALIAGYQEVMTARVVDLRHWLLPLAALLLALCGYLAGAYAMLANKRYGVAVVMLPTLFLFAQADGVAALAVQLVVFAYLVLLVGIAFRPNLGEPPRGVGAVVATALPVQVGAYFLLWMLGIGYELAWTATGTHPLNSPSPPQGGYIEASRAEPKDRLLAGIADSRHPDAPMWQAQVALSEVSVIYPMRELPRRHQLTNTMQPPEFDDPERPIRWVFSHDRMRFVGYGVLDRQPRGELGAGLAQDDFPGPALPYADNIVFTPTVAYQYDPEQQRLFPRVRLPQGEVFASPPGAAGENIAVLSNRALYFYPGREASNTLDPLQPLLRVPLPGPVGELMSVELIELLDGYLLSFTYTYGAWAGEVIPSQQVLRVDGAGKVELVARRTLGFDLPRAYTMRTWWLSPVLRGFALSAQRLFAAPNPLDDGELAPPPRDIVVLAVVLCLLSLLASIWLTRRQRLTPPARWAWVLACGVIGLPALLGLWLLFPVRER
ncbi:MAG: hypothetical protein M3Y70_07255 [Pseudomonadota bacterium]|nr:hypothetical protein [Pseudomonadota bacterium]